MHEVLQVRPAVLRSILALLFAGSLAFGQDLPDEYRNATTAIARLTSMSSSITVKRRGDSQARMSREALVNRSSVEADENATLTS